MSRKPREWRVLVHDKHGSIELGTVIESDEALARCAALSKFGTEGERDEQTIQFGGPRDVIYEDDDFDVEKVQQ